MGSQARHCRKRRVSIRSRRSRLFIERLEDRLLLASDFGDAPEPYSTTLAENGARHVAVGPMLGATRDAEVDGIHSAIAYHDDVDGERDEDGVTFGTIRVGQLDATATVNVQGGPAQLDAWIDFNRDGSWGGAWEQIADNVPVQSGDNTIEFDVPSWAVSGTTFARFRLSTAGNLGVGGQAEDGEVEDYAISILASNRTSSSLGPTNTITTSAQGAISLFAADVDSDGDMDVVSGSFLDAHLAWYENDGQNFTRHVVAMDGATAGGVFAADIDGDGDTDLVPSSFPGQILWYENDGSQSFKKHTISNDGARSDESTIVLDFDLDGDADLVSSSFWYENDGMQNFTARQIAPTVNASLVTPADIDSDGDLDFFAYHGFDIVWFEFSDDHSFATHVIVPAFTRSSIASALFSSDVDRDGDADLIVSYPANDIVVWYENDGQQVFVERTISIAVDSPKGVFGTDIDGDGDVDVLTASERDDTVAVYENDGQQRFTKRVIANDADFAKSVFAADLDADGDLDVLSASTGDHKVAWYESNSLPTLVAVDAVTIDEDAPQRTIGLSGITAGSLENQPLRLSVVSNPTWLIPMPSLNYQLGNTTAELTFAPTQDASGEAIIKVTVIDGGLDRDLDTVGDNAATETTITVQVNAVNDAPIAEAQSVSMAEDTNKAITLAGSDTENQELSFEILNTPEHGQLSGTVPNLTYHPKSNFHGEDHFTFRVNDGEFDSETVTIDLTLLPVNDPPVAEPQSLATDEDTARDVVFTGSDVDGDSLTFSLVSLPQYGSVAGTLPDLTYTPEKNYHGEDTIVFTVADGMATSARATVSLEVRSINDPPTVENLQTTTDEDTPIWIELPYSDLDGDELSIQIIAGDIQGDATIVVDGSSRMLSYDPSRAGVLQELARDESVEESITLSVSDGNGGIRTATVVISVHGVTDWQNPAEPLDANGDDEISPIDALVIVNSLNDAGSRQLLPTLGDPQFWFDVNGDGFISPIDVLLIINRLNGLQDEGEASVAECNGRTVNVSASSRLTGSHFWAARKALIRVAAQETSTNVTATWNSPRAPFRPAMRELSSESDRLQTLDEFFASHDLPRTRRETSK